MDLPGVDERAVVELRLDIGVQVPGSTGPDTGLDQEAALGGVLLEMEEPLFRRTVRVGAEDDLERELARSGQRKGRNLDPVVDPVELEGRPPVRLDDLGVSFHPRGMAADGREGVGLPDD